MGLIYTIISEWTLSDYCDLGQYKHNNILLKYVLITYFSR